MSVSPPGETLLDFLKENCWTQVMLAEILKRPFKTINEIIKGKSGITRAMALDLEDVTGISAEFWINREGNYRVYLERKKRNDNGQHSN